MLINSRPPDRRRMIHEISDLLNIPAEYLRPPTYGYRIGNLVVNRDGTITTDSPQVIATIRPFLLERGYLPDEASATSAAPPPSPTHRSRMEICAPLGSITVRQLKILIQILYCRQHILNRMLRRQAFRFQALQRPSAILNGSCVILSDLIHRRLISLDPGRNISLNLTQHTFLLVWTHNSRTYSHIVKQEPVFHTVGGHEQPSLDGNLTA